MHAQDGIDFDDLANSEEFGKFIRMFIDLTGLPVGIRHPTRNERKLYYDESEVNPVCHLIRSSEAGLKACMNCNLHFFQTVHNLGKGLQYRCHAGLIDFALPVFVENKIIAYLNCGQILPHKPSKEGFKELLKNLADVPVDKKALQKAYFKSPYMSTKRVDAAMQMVTFITEVFCEHNRIKRNIYKKMKYTEVNIAKEYIKTKFHEPISVAEVAEYVHLSENYFSRLFSSVSGETFTEYLRRVRISEAKRILVTTDLPITRIAYDVGFGSLQYFNNTFKIFENCSPREYRKRHTHFLKPV